MQELLIMTHDKIQEVIDTARARFDSLASLCDAIALLDMLHCFADNVASSRLPWCRPAVTESYDLDTENSGSEIEVDISNQQPGKGSVLAIRNGRHAIDVYNSGNLGTDYVPNDTFAAPYQNYIVLTGINGSGKSTYLRQIAIIVILAHCGSYVPAEDAFIPIRSRLLTRIGTSDDQEHNISTFMLEMRETASICDQANDRSLVLIDELGRATSNEDGVAIAWSVSEYLLVKRAMTFFVTHYPQLSKLAEVYSNVQNQHLSATTINTAYGEEVRYSHKISPGACQMTADYGVEMAGTCGWPIDVVRDARTLHSFVEKNLPESSLCTRTSGPIMDLLELRVRSEQILSDIAKHLVAMKESQSRLGKEARRSYLQDLRNVLVPNDPPLLASITAILEEQNEVDPQSSFSKTKVSALKKPESLEIHTGNSPCDECEMIPLSGTFSSCFGEASKSQFTEVDSADENLTLSTDSSSDESDCSSSSDDNVESDEQSEGSSASTNLSKQNAKLWSPCIHSADPSRTSNPGKGLKDDVIVCSKESPSKWQNCTESPFQFSAASRGSKIEIACLKECDDGK